MCNFLFFNFLQDFFDSLNGDIFRYLRFLRLSLFSVFRRPKGFESAKQGNSPAEDQATIQSNRDFFREKIFENFTDKALFNIYSYDVGIFHHILKTINGGDVHSDQMTVDTENNSVAQQRGFVYTINI